MKVRYECEFCGEMFSNRNKCITHESMHYEGIERLKYLLLHDAGTNICDCCKNSYYVYGCEQNCNHKDCNISNNYKYFEPLDTLYDATTKELMKRSDNNDF